MNSLDTHKMSTIWKKYSPVIVLVPAIVGIHYGWYLLQQNERIVPRDQQVREQPIVSVSISNCLLLVHLKPKTNILNAIFPSPLLGSKGILRAT